MNEHSGNSGQLQQPSEAAGLNEPFGDSEQLGTDAGNGGDALDVPFAWTWISQAGERHVTTSERHARNVAGADGCVVHAITPKMLAARQPVGVDPVAEIIEEIAGDVESCVSDACGYLASDNGWRDYGIYRDDFTKRYHALPDRIRALAAPPAPEMSPDFTDTARAAISWVLWHHQGGSSAIGQPLRYALGMGDHEELSAQQISEAKRYAESVGARTDDFKHPAPAVVPMDAPYSLDADPAGIRSRVADCITGTMMVGAQNHTPPPAGHWLEPFWNMARADAAQPQPAAVPVDGLRESQILAKDHDGMRVSYSGLLRQARGALTRGSADPALAEMLRQLEKHMEELGKRWYAGDRLVVDELLQLYCIETNARRALLATHPQPTAACVNIDAMRYRYLRAQPVEGGPWGTPRIAIPSSERAGEFANGDDADAAIDAAIAAQQAKPEVR